MQFCHTLMSQEFWPTPPDRAGVTESGLLASLLAHAFSVQQPSFNFLTDVLRCCINISTYFSSSWCHLFCEVHHSLLQQCTPTTWCCHPRALQLGWCSSACKPPYFSSKLNDGHYGQTILVLFHQTGGHFSKKYDLCPHVQLQTVVWLFYGGFGAVASS